MPLNKLITMPLVALLLGAAAGAKAQQVTCQERLENISRAYDNGQWAMAKDSAVTFINTSAGFSRVGLNANIFFYYGDCNSYLPKAYYYLIRSLYRLSDIRAADSVYKIALRQGMRLDFDTTSNNMYQHFSKIILLSRLYGIYTGLTTTGVGIGYKLGFQYIGGNSSLFLNSPFYLDISFDNSLFKHISGQRSGIFGKPLNNPLNAYPRYGFDISGNERFVDLLALIKIPLYRDGRTGLYLLEGFYGSYYLNSAVHHYTIDVYNSPTDSVRYTTTPGGHVPGLGMDLQHLYSNRFSGGMLFGVRNDRQLSNKFLLFLELRYQAGSNFSYAFKPFNSYKAGISYMTLTIGISRTNYFFKRR